MSDTVGVEEKIPRNFITDIIDEDLKEGRVSFLAQYLSLLRPT